MASVTLDTLCARVRERADLVGSDFVTDAANSLWASINAANGELYDLIVHRPGNNLFLTSEAFVTAANTSTVALPATFYLMHGVDLQINGQYRSLEKFNFGERNRYRNMPANAEDIRYRVESGVMRLFPPPSGVYSGLYWFIPVVGVLSNGSHTVNYPNNWDEFIVVEAAKKVLDKEESDTSVLQAESSNLRQRIMAMAEVQDPGEPETVSDVRFRNSQNPYWEV